MIDPPPPWTVITSVPAWLGRAPITGETILVGFADSDPERAVCLALHPDADPMDETNAHRQLVTDGAESVAVVRYTGRETPESLIGLRFHAAAAARYALELIGVVIVVPAQRATPGYFRTLPDPIRHPLPTPTRTESPS